MESEKEKEKLNKFAERIFLSLNAKNKDEIITEVIIKTDLDKRIEISNAYLQKYDRDLYTDLKSKLNGQFKELAMYLFLPPEEYMSKILKKVLKGFQIDEIAIYEIFTICTQDELKKIESAFKKETGKELKSEIEKNFPSTALLLRNRFCKKNAEGLSTPSNFLVLSIERGQLRSLVSTLFSILVLSFPFQSHISRSEPMWLVMLEVFLSIPGLGISRKFSTRVKKQ